MKLSKYLTLFMALLVMSSIGAKAGQITHRVSYDPSKLSINYDTINGNAYARVYYDDFYNSKNEGEPELPYDILLFSVPYNAVNFSIQVQANKHTDMHIKSTVYPAQAPREIDDTSSVFTQPNNSVYGLSSFYPYISCQIVSNGYMFGDNNIVVAQFSPITYEPINGTLRIATDVSLTINYDINTNIIPSLSRCDPDLKAIETSIIADNVLNGHSVITNSYIPTQLPPVIGQNLPTLPTYNYCIITSRELEPAFKKIIAMKRQKGLSAGTVCIEDLMASSICNGGDIMIDTIGNTYPTITDSAGVVRQYLKYAFQSPSNPTIYVLMGGKAPSAPIRYLHATKYHGRNRYHIPSDLYFSDLSQIWIKNDSDSVFGDEYVFHNQFYCYEFDPSHQILERAINYFPDVYVGRLLCKNNEEIDNYSNKLFKYVFNPGNGDRSYLSKAVFIFNYGFNYSKVIKSAQHLFNEQIKRIQEDSIQRYPTGAQFIDSLNRCNYGFLSFHAHGEPQSISLYDDKHSQYLLTALDRYQPLSDSYVVDENNNGLDCLINKNSPSICYSIACANIPYEYDDSFNGFTTVEHKYNMGESFTLGKNYGGPAFLGLTRLGYRIYTMDIEKAFYESMYIKKFYSIGAAEAMSKSYPFYYAYNAYRYMHNLIGDPEFEMWTSEPSIYDNIYIERTQLGFIIHGISENDTIAYCDNNGHQGRITTHNDFAYLMDISPNSSVMIYNHEHIPYMVPLMLQNCNINNSQYVYASSFSAGKSVVPTINHGNVTIKNGAVYEIDASGDVHLGEGFIVENGATFNVKTPSKVTIDGCVFQSGAKVKIESGNVEFVGKFTAELGSKVEFKQYVDD